MAKTTSRTVIYDAPVEQVLKVVTSPEFQLAQRKKDAAVVDAEFKEIRRDDTEIVFEIHSVEYERGMTGLNKNKTVKSQIFAKWDVAKLVGTWSYSSEASDRFKLAGVDRLEPVRDQTKAAYEVSVDIKIPLIGKKVEGLIVKEIEKQQAAYDAMLLEHCHQA